MVVVVVLVGVSSTADARRGIQLRLGFEGAALGDPAEDVRVTSADTSLQGSGESGLETTLGFGVHLDIPMGAFASAGPGITVVTLNTADRDRAGIGRDILIDLGYVLRLGYELGARRWRLYLAVPAGLTVWVVNEDVAPVYGKSPDTELDVERAWGLHVGAAMGLQVDGSTGHGNVAPRRRPAPTAEWCCRRGRLRSYQLRPPPSAGAR